MATSTAISRLPFGLYPDEEVEPENVVRPHWIELVRRAAPAGVGVFAVFVLILLLGARLDPATRTLVVLLALAVAGLWVLGAYQEWNSVYLIVTNKRIIMLRGILIRSVKMFPLNNVMYVLATDGQAGRMLGYGRVDVVSPGEKGPEAASILDPAPDPHGLANRIMGLINPPVPPDEPKPVRVVGQPVSVRTVDGQSDQP